MSHFLVFDIETVPNDWESFSESQQEYLLRRAETDEEKEQKKKEFALSPLTANAVCIGMQLVEVVDPRAESQEERYILKKSIAYSLNNSLEDGETIEAPLNDGNISYLSNEKTMLEKFWRIFNKYPQAHLVSFNGRTFDAPFLMLRSAKLQIRPTRNLMTGTKFNYPLHTDLIDELCFYMPSQSGATRRYNFDFFTRAFGITSPKEAGVDGSKVAEYFADGRINEISEYCLRDVKATWELYLYWEKYLKF